MAIKFVKVKRNITVGSNPGEKYLARLFRGTDVSIDQIANENHETLQQSEVFKCSKQYFLTTKKNQKNGLRR